MLDFLTDNLSDALKNVNMNLVFEIRIRAKKPIIVNYGGVYRFLGVCGLTDLAESAIYADCSDIETILYRAGEYSVYSVTEQLRQGFLTGGGGERIGLAGIFIYENGRRYAVKEITSINIRVPHEIIGCADVIFQRCFSNGIQSALILSCPGRGKTTILRDLARQISNRYRINILINDERNEISAACRDFSLDVGMFTDVIRCSDKKDAFECAIRSMRPDLMICDELISRDEINSVAACVHGGVSVIASAHCRNQFDLKASPILSAAVQQRIFDYYIFLSEEGIGRLACVCDAQLNPVQES